MYAMWIVFIILGFVVGAAAVFGAVIAFAEDEFGLWLLGVVAAVAAYGMAGFGIAQVTSIERQQCEEAGYEWITGTCFGSNVNVNQP
jgi:hypothetical protein